MALDRKRTLEAGAWVQGYAQSIAEYAGEICDYARLSEQPITDISKRVRYTRNYIERIEQELKAIEALLRSAND